jgi:CRISPR-associated protein Csx1
LALQYALSRVQDSALDVLKGAFRLWEGNVTVNLARREVRSVFRLNPDAVYALLLVEAVRRRLGGPEYPARLEVLKRSKALYRAINKSFYYLISNELKLIKESLKEKKPSGTLRLCELYGEDCESGAPITRVMIAHAGLQKEFVLLDPSDKQLRYTDDVENLLKSCGLLIEMRD